MARQDEAALKLLRWELEGHGDQVIEAMLRHPDVTLAEAVILIEKEVPSLSPHEPAPHMPAPGPVRPRPAEISSAPRRRRRAR